MYACAIDGELIDKANAKISVMDHGFLYGDGVFEGLRFYQHVVFSLEEHLDRLFDSAKAISLTVPQSSKDIATSIYEAILASGLQDGYIRLIVTRGDGPLGIDPASCCSPKVIIIVDQLNMISSEARDKGARLIIASVRRLAADQVDPRIKSLNYMNQLMARLEANAVGADEAVMLNTDGRVAEGTADNIFIVKDGRLKTPPVWEGSLAGITRACIIKAAQNTGIPVDVEPLTQYDLFCADECFLTGTGAELIPVREISGRFLTEVRGPVFCCLAQAYKHSIEAAVA